MPITPTKTNMPPEIYAPKFDIAPEKKAIGRLLFYWEGNFSGAMLNFGGGCNGHFKAFLRPQNHHQHHSHLPPSGLDAVRFEDDKFTIQQKKVRNLHKEKCLNPHEVHVWYIYVHVVVDFYCKCW